MSHHADFSSWPRDQEMSFVVYEQRASESQTKAFVVGIVTALAVLFVAVGIYLGVEPDRKDMTKDMNMSNLTKKAKTAAPAPASTPTPAPAAAPSTDDKKPDPAAAPADDKKADPAPADDKKPADPPADKK